MRALTLQQFRGACAVVDSGFNVSRAATALHTTQSAVSKTIKGLESELGSPIFSSSSVRMIGLTEYGQEFIGLARGILRDTEIAVTRAREDIKDTRGVLRIATTHLHARFSLPRVIQAFQSRYPEVSIELEQGDASDIGRWVAARRVHIGVCAVSFDAPSGLITLPAMKLARCIVVPHGHELLSIDKPRLADIARYRLVCFNEAHPAGVRLRELFKKSGLNPAIAISATDATVQKEYVAAGMGVAILHRITFGPEDERKLAVIDASHLIPATETQLIFRHGEYLRAYVYDFIEAFAPQWNRRSVIDEIEKQTASNGDSLEMRVASPCSGQALSK